jgi:hypothetical protein
MNIKKYTIGILEILVMRLQLPAPEKRFDFRLPGRENSAILIHQGSGSLENLIIDCRTIPPPDCRFTLISIIRI